MKSLLPSLKEKKRYLVFEIISDSKVSVNRPLNEVISSIKGILGLFESAEAGIMPVDYKQGKGMVKISNKYADKVKASFLFINEIGTQNVIVRSLGVSGMINKARQYM